MQNRSKKVYFHNLKFDGQFLLSYFFNLGYQYSEYLTKEKQMKYIIDDFGTFYALIVSFKNNQGKIKTVTFLDSMKIYPYSLKVVAKQFGFAEQKGEMDYELLRRPNHEMTADEIEYFRKDIVILRKAMEQAYLKGLKKMTIGANALADYTSIIGKQNFKIIFPKIPKNIDEFCRKAYKGGCCMVAEKYANKIVPTYSYDINSHYPTQLKYRPMPYGTPKYFKGKFAGNKDKLYIQHLACSFNLKPNKLPCIQLKNTMMFAKNEWIKHCNYKMDLYLTNVDLDLFFENYDVYDITYYDGYEFKAITGLFDEYIDKWYSIKMNTTDKGERAFSKLFINNIYGKFGTSPQRNSLRYELQSGVVKRCDCVKEEVSTIYLPVAIWTTAYGRAILLRHAQSQIEDFVYCDTDSIHFTKPAKYLPIDNKQLGYFKYEYYGLGKHIKQKTYIIHKQEEGGQQVDTWDIKCAGLNQDLIDKSQISFDMFHLGATFNKLKTKRVIGGVYLFKDIHTIK